MNNNSSLQNVYNWGKIYNSPFQRWKDLYPQYLEGNQWKGICIRCNKKTEMGKGTRWCNNCYNEYKKLENFYRCKAYRLLKKTTLDTKCEITGCNKRMFKYYFETLFDDKMNWENQSIYWQIDHRIPISWFNLENIEELKFACNYKNLQPMEKVKNLNKLYDYPQNNIFNYDSYSYNKLTFPF
jgi:hypothetical protein